MKTTNQPTNPSSSKPTPATQLIPPAAGHPLVHSRHMHTQLVLYPSSSNFGENLKHKSSKFGEFQTNSQYLKWVSIDAFFICRGGQLMVNSFLKMVWSQRKRTKILVEREREREHWTTNKNWVFIVNLARLVPSLELARYPSSTKFECQTGEANANWFWCILPFIC